MNGRRGFFALVGNAAVTGLVSHRASAARPTLILPPAGLVEPAMPSGNPLLAAMQSQMDALLEIKQKVPPAEFQDWLKGGLRLARFYRGEDEATVERRVDAAVQRYGSIVGARRAGAL